MILAGFALRHHCLYAQDSRCVSVLRQVEITDKKFVQLIDVSMTDCPSAFQGLNIISFFSNKYSAPDMMVMINQRRPDSALMKKLCYYTDIYGIRFYMAPGMPAKIFKETGGTTEVCFDEMEMSCRENFRCLMEYIPFKKWILYFSGYYEPDDTDPRKLWNDAYKTIRISPSEMLPRIDIRMKVKATSDEILRNRI